MGKIGKETFEKVRQILELRLSFGLGYNHLNGAWVEVKHLRLRRVDDRNYIAGGVYLYGINEEEYSEKFRETFNGVAVEIKG
jgi:hypothetical protein